MSTHISSFDLLREVFKGDILTDNITRILYATDASIYKMLPLAVVYPKDVNDCIVLVMFARKEKMSIIPRTAGTSIAGQVVGNGIVVDFSRYFNQIVELNVEEKQIKVQPGVILDELNLFLKEHGLFFGPETSTASRCMIGGMLGNNSCGARSLIYGSMREHVLKVNAILSDGTQTIFKALNVDEFHQKRHSTNHLEAQLYNSIFNILSDKNTQQKIHENYPDVKLHRRNTGYALDALLSSNIFNESDENFNFCKLLCGSEGTLALATEITLNLVDLPPKNKAIICAHFNSLEESLIANTIIVKHAPHAVELMDDVIIKLAKNNPLQSQNTFFIEGNPAAILIIEYAHKSEKILTQKLKDIIQDIRNENLGYAFPIIEKNNEISRVWEFRKAGLGLLFGLPGDAKPIAFIEDTAVVVEKLPNYIAALKKVFQKQNVEAVFYAHMGAGELHIRPILDLKKPDDRIKFRIIADKTAKLVKKYKGALSGEHGDGRVRGEFLPYMVSKKIYKLFLEIKKTWDPKGIFNPHKIVEVDPMDEDLRYENGQQTHLFQTYFDFSKDEGLLRSVEKCNGTADCRNTIQTGRVMCPSYQAGLLEYNSTRGRANAFRELLTQEKEMAFENEELYKILALCISCKACKSECPSNIDMTKMKAEFLQHYYDKKGISLRTKAIAFLPDINRLFALFPGIYNFFSALSITKRIMGIATFRRLPRLDAQTVEKWVQKNSSTVNNEQHKKVWLLLDEFSNYNETHIGKKAFLLLEKLGYTPTILSLTSGRTYLSKGLLKKAESIARKNINLLQDKVSYEQPLVGIEPSAILSFRDEYSDLLRDIEKEHALKIARYSFTIEEFLYDEIKKGNIISQQFTNEQQTIHLHGHCFQKSLSSTAKIVHLLSLPVNYHVIDLKTGCCGMAGSFGYEKEHVEFSKKIANLQLVPAIKEISDRQIIAASGTSCRHQISDLTSRTALHPLEILYNALV